MNKKVEIKQSVIPIKLSPLAANSYFLAEFNLTGASLWKL